MKPLNRIFNKWIFLILLLAIVSISFAWIYNKKNVEIKSIPNKASENQQKVDEKAKKILKDMSHSLKDLKEFSFKSKGYFEIIDSTGKEKMKNYGEAFVKRPDKIKVQRTGEKSDLEFYCDGQLFTIYGKRLNYYASSPAASDLDETFDNIRDNLDIHLPAMDLLYSDVYEGLMQDVNSGKYVGLEDMNNEKCHHLSFAGNDIDWQIWIEEKNNLPKKYMIISKNIEGKPESVIEIKEWKMQRSLPDKIFSFVPPKGAHKIDFLKLEPVSQIKK